MADQRQSSGQAVKVVASVMMLMGAVLCRYCVLIVVGFIFLFRAGSILSVRFISYQRR